LLIVGSQKFYENLADDELSEHLRDVLHNAECPVVVVPEVFDFPTKNVMAYDESEASVFAIKQFIYLFPELIDNETTIVYPEEDPKKDIPEEEHLKELVEPHLSHYNFLKLDIDPEKYFDTWISEQKYSMLVGGQKGRPLISQIFKKNYLNKVIADHKLPVFITHN
jgi:hypothetical protein